MKKDKITDKKRLQALDSYDIIDSKEESLYNDITALAAAICNAPISLISLVDDKQQFFKSHHGLDLKSTSLDESFCKYLIIDDLDMFIVKNPKEDERFANYTIVKEGLEIGFYAGVSLTNEDGHQLGSLCVMNKESRQLTNLQINGLKTLAKQVMQLFELRKSKNIARHQKNKLEQKGILLDNIVTATGIGIWERDIKNNLMQLNYGCLSILGYKSKNKKTIEYPEWEGFIHPEDLDMVKAKLHDCFENKTEIYDAKYRILNLNGETTWVHDNGKILTWEDQQPLLMYGTIQNITQKVNDDFELIKLKNNQDAIINNTKDLLWSVDTDYRLIMANHAYHELVEDNIGYQFSVGDVVFSDNFDNDINDKWKSFYARALKGGQFSIKAKFYNPKKMSTTYGLTSFNPLYDNKGNLIGITCYSKDITSEVLAQQVLLSAKEEMQKIMDTSLDIICTIDEEGYFLSINKAVKEVWGYEPKDIIGTNYIELVYKEDHLVTEQSAASVLSGEKVVNFENRYVHKDGHVVPMLWSSNWDEKDRVYYCIAKDNTENKKAELQLEHSERLFKTLVQESSDIISITDLKGNFTYVSPSSINVIQISPEELIGTNAFDYIHPDDIEQVAKSFSLIAEQKSVQIAPYRFKNKKGEWRWFIANVSNQINSPTIEGVIVTSRDIHETREAKEQLIQSERRFKTLVQEGSDMICLIDEKADFTYASPTSIKVLNITPEQFIGTNAFDYIHPDDYETVYNEFIKVLKIPQVNIKPFRFKHGDGHWVWLETVITNKFDEPTLKGIVANSKDVTTKVQHLKAIEKQNSQLKEIAWTQSHELRAPVARLLGLITLIRDENHDLDFEEKDRMLQYIYDSANEIDVVIKKIVDSTVSQMNIEEIK